MVMLSSSEILEQGSDDRAIRIEQMRRCLIGLPADAAIAHALSLLTTVIASTAPSGAAAVDALRECARALRQHEPTMQRATAMNIAMRAGEGGRA
jgi:hypothetical protein